MSIQTFQLGPDRCAGELRLHLGEKLRGFFETKHDRAHEPRGPSVRFAWDGVRFVQERGRAAQSTGEHGSGMFLTGERDIYEFYNFGFRFVFSFR